MIAITEPESIHVELHFDANSSHAFEKSRSRKMTMRKRSNFAAAIMCALVISGFYYAPPALAEDEYIDKDKWQFEITPYLFAAAMDGTATVRGISADIDMSFGDIWDRLDKAGMLYMTARKNDWVFALDAIYFKIQDEQSQSWQGPLGNTNTARLDADMTQQVYGLSFGRRVLDQKAKLDVMGVARYTQLDTNLNLALTTGSALLPDGSRAVSGKEDWWDAAIAARVATPIGQKWDLMAYADIGAGGSDLTYQILAGANWQFSKTFSMKLAYRYFYQDYESNNFKWDMTTAGPVVGLGIRF
jgi:hypothetical protein